MQVVIEDVPERSHLAIEGLFAGMAKRRMTNVVNQGEGFSQIRVQSQGRSHRACDLRYLYGMGKPVPEVVGTSIRENLGFVLQTSKCAGVDDAIAIALKIRSVRM